MLERRLTSIEAILDLLLAISQDIGINRGIIDTLNGDTNVVGSLTSTLGGLEQYARDKFETIDLSQVEINKNNIGILNNNIDVENSFKYIIEAARLSHAESEAIILTEIGTSLEEIELTYGKIISTDDITSINLKIKNLIDDVELLEDTLKKLSDHVLLDDIADITLTNNINDALTIIQEKQTVLNSLLTDLVNKTSLDFETFRNKMNLLISDTKDTTRDLADSLFFKQVEYGNEVNGTCDTELLAGTIRDNIETTGNESTNLNIVVNREIGNFKYKILSDGELVLDDKVVFASDNTLIKLNTSRRDIIPDGEEHVFRLVNEYDENYIIADTVDIMDDNEIIGDTVICKSGNFPTDVTDTTIKYLTFNGDVGLPSVGTIVNEDGTRLGFKSTYVNTTNFKNHVFLFQYDADGDISLIEYKKIPQLIYVGTYIDRTTTPFFGLLSLDSENVPLFDVNYIDDLISGSTLKMKAKDNILIKKRLVKIRPRPTQSPISAILNINEVDIFTQNIDIIKLYTINNDSKSKILYKENEVITNCNVINENELEIIGGSAMNFADDNGTLHKLLITGDILLNAAGTVIVDGVTHTFDNVNIANITDYDMFVFTFKTMTDRLTFVEATQLPYLRYFGNENDVINPVCRSIGRQDAARYNLGLIGDHEIQDLVRLMEVRMEIVRVTVNNGFVTLPCTIQPDLGNIKWVRHYQPNGDFDTLTFLLGDNQNELKVFMETEGDYDTISIDVRCVITN